MTFKGYKEASRTNWGKDDDEHGFTLDQINTGALLRIADALEAMANPFERLLESVRYLKDRKSDLEKEAEYLRRSNRGLRAYISRSRKRS